MPCLSPSLSFNNDYYADAEDDDGKGKGKVLPRIGHEGPEGEYRYSSTLSLTLTVDGVGGQRNTPAALPPGKRPGSHYKGGWVGPRAGLDGCEKSRPHRDSIPGPSNP
jgi:hypothetical protein